MSGTFAVWVGIWSTKSTDPPELAAGLQNKLFITAQQYFWNVAHPTLISHFPSQKLEMIVCTQCIVCIKNIRRYVKRKQSRTVLAFWSVFCLFLQKVLFWGIVLRGVTVCKDPNITNKLKLATEAEVWGVWLLKYIQAVCHMNTWRWPSSLQTQCSATYFPFQDL